MQYVEKAELEGERKIDYKIPGLLSPTGSGSSVDASSGDSLILNIHYT